MLPRALAAVAALATLTTLSPAAAITLGQVDDFQDQTLEGWFSPGFANPNPPLVGPICGPAGCGAGTDYYARIAGNGIGGPGRAIVLNNNGQWAGDYTAAGVTSIALDANNLGTTTLDLRLAIVSFDASGGSFVTDAIQLAPHGTGEAGWTQISFDVSPGAWTAAPASFFGAAGVDIGVALSSVATLRLVDNAALSAQGATKVGLVGIDNITAVPEPGTLALLGLGLGWLAYRGRRI